ncbi:hypothetical protein Tco_0413552 [Tanacetum coccineum]
MGDTLEFATLVPCDGKVAVVGGTHDGNVLVWELGDGDEWILIERMPLELAKSFAGSSTKCAGIEGGVCLYKDIDSAMVVWRRVKNHKNKWEWCSIDGCNTFKGETVCLSEESCKGIGNLLWMASADDNFKYGLPNHNAAPPLATRNAKLIGALQKFVGPDVKAFLSHVKPALLSAVEAL